MNDVFKNFGIIILAAGQGKRLGCTGLPKVLYKIGGKPIISYVLEALKKGEVPKEQVCLVVGFEAEKVKEKIGPGYIYALQKERLGTAHAAHTGEEALPGDLDDILVLNGDDTAFYTFKSIRNFVSQHIENNCDITLLTCEPEGPLDICRVIRNENGNVVEIVEKENLQEEQKKLKEISTGTFCFKREWFKKHYNNIKPISGLGELGLPSMVEQALKYKANFQAVKLENANEWFGINTKEQLAEADRRKSKKG